MTTTMEALLEAQGEIEDLKAKCSHLETLLIEAQQREIAKDETVRLVQADRTCPFCGLVF